MKINKNKELQLSYDRLLEVLQYDFDVGIFIWKIKISNRTIIGSEAGNIDISTGYRRIQIDGKRYQAHRLAWFYITKEWPHTTLDHIDNNKNNNTICNLRLCTETDNQHNKPSYNNTTGFKGVSKHIGGKFVASFSHNRYTYYCGIYMSAEEAFERYKIKAKEIMGEFYNENIVF